MPCQRLDIRCKEESATELASILMEDEATGSWYEDGILHVYFEASISLEESIALLKLLGYTDVVLSEEADTNWNAVWESNFKEVVLSDKLQIRAKFHPSRALEHEILIHPSMAFGTGHHPTSQLMLERLLEIPVAETHVLDMGCGSGILAILASQLGAQDVLALDYDPNSVENSMLNVQLNEVQNVEIEQAEDLTTVTTEFDIIFKQYYQRGQFEAVALLCRQTQCWRANTSKRLTPSR